MMCQKAVLLVEFRYVYCIGWEDIFMGEVKEKELNLCSAVSVLWYCNKDKQEDMLKHLTPVACVNSVKRLKMLSR